VGLLSSLFGGGGGKGKGHGQGHGKAKAPAKNPLAKLRKVNIEKRFDLLGRTGQGSMSKVWRAYDRELGRTICLKVLDKVKTAKFEARFLGLQRPIEGAIMSGLHHENIVKTYEFGLTTHGEQYIVMELVDGVGLNFLVETRAQQMKENRINYLVQLCDALDYLHKQGFLHRDICPRNTMVTSANVIKLIDFGLGIPNTSDFQKPGNRTGTPDYLAPELIKRTATDHRVDLFALGVTAYEMYTGCLPWDRAQSMQTLLSHLNNAGKDPRDVVPDLDERIVKFLIKAIERDPRDRYQNASEFRDAVKRLPPDT
jgi:serine/threonine protein kinase